MSFCFHVLKAARQVSGPPDETTGKYFADVAASINLARYFTEIERLSRQPRDRNTAVRFRSVFGQDASCVLRVACRHLMRGRLTPDQRAMIEAIHNLEDWAMGNGR